MTFIPHISVTTKPGHPEGASVKVSFIKELLGGVQPGVPCVEVAGPVSVEATLTDERPGPELDRVSAEVAHGVAKLVHETLELQEELNEESVDKTAQEVDSFLGKSDFDFTGAGAFTPTGVDDYEGDAAALADAKNFNEQLVVENAWYRHLVHQVLHGFAFCPHCKAVIEVHRNAQGVASSNCTVCGGIGYLERRDDGSLVKYNIEKDSVDNPPGFKTPLMPEAEWFEPVVKDRQGRGYLEIVNKGDKETKLQILYKRMTDRALEAIINATKEATRLQHEYVGTEHILAALMRGGNSVATTALNNLKLDLQQVLAELNKLSVSGNATKPPEAYTPQAKQALLVAEKEMVKLGHAFIGTEHILLGIMQVRDNATVAVQLLFNLGVSPEAVIKEVYDLLGYDASQDSGSTDPS